MTVRPKVSHRTRNIVIVAVVIIVLIDVGVAVELLGNDQVHVSGTYLSIWYNGPSGSGYFGPSSRAIGPSVALNSNSVFTESLTYQNNASSPDGGTGNLLISSIQIDQQQFVVQSVSPSMPYLLSPGASVTFKLQIRAPVQYSGPLTFTLTTS